MPYRQIIFRAGEYYHLYNRGNNFQPIFFEHENYLYCLRLIRKHLVERNQVSELKRNQYLMQSFKSSHRLVGVIFLALILLAGCTQTQSTPTPSPAPIAEVRSDFEKTFRPSTLRALSFCTIRITITSFATIPIAAPGNSSPPLPSR